jgi:ribosomal protein S18 acetylase RimI-like enzyme
MSQEDVNVRRFGGAEDLRAMQRVSAASWRLDPRLVQLTVGELAWSAYQHVGRDDDWKRAVWFDDDEPVAWAWLTRPASLEWQVRPDRTEVAEDVVAWFEEEAEAADRHVEVRAANRPGREALARHGYEPQPAAPFMALNTLALSNLAEPEVPAGYRLTTMAETPELEARVDVHRAAFHPSRVTNESYANLAAHAWPYRADLDCVAVAHDGTFASYALGWLDASNRTGELEPVGTHPEHRRRGLASAVSLYALHRLRGAGAEIGIVGCRGDDDYPAPKRVYEGIGFRELTRTIPYVREAPRKP